MTKTNKVRVAVLYGGRSAEHEVSLISASNVIQNLDRTRFDVVPIGIDKQGSWFLGNTEQLEHSKTLTLEQDLKHLLFTPHCIGKPSSLMSSAFTTLKKSERLFDVVFPAIHGTFCEDGTVQGLLEMAGIPYVGCGVLASSVGMDKDVSKRLVSHAGLNVSPYVAIKAGEWKKNPEKISDVIAKKLRYPLFIKPANTGSSIGIQKIKASAELPKAIENAFLYDTKVLVEQGVDAMELELSVLEALEYGEDPFVSVVGEVRSNHEFYSYVAKYLDENGAELIIPAPIDQTLQEEARQIAKKIFKILECEGMARVDLFLDRESKQIYFNEVNTIPGFTQISMYPKLMNATGVGYKELLTHLVDLAIARFARKEKLNHDYVKA